MGSVGSKKRVVIRIPTQKETRSKRRRFLSCLPFLSFYFSFLPFSFLFFSLLFSSLSSFFFHFLFFPFSFLFLGFLGCASAVSVFSGVLLLAFSVVLTKRKR